MLNILSCDYLDLAGDEDFQTNFLAFFPWYCWGFYRKQRKRKKIWRRIVIQEIELLNKRLPDKQKPHWRLENVTDKYNRRPKSEFGSCHMDAYNRILDS